MNWFIDLSYQPEILLSMVWLASSSSGKDYKMQYKSAFVLYVIVQGLLLEASM